MKIPEEGCLDTHLDGDSEERGVVVSFGVMGATEETCAGASSGASSGVTGATGESCAGVSSGASSGVTETTEERSAGASSVVAGTEERRVGPFSGVAETAGIGGL